jgi:hypothetical protein
MTSKTIIDPSALTYDEYEIRFIDDAGTLKYNIYNTSDNSLITPTPITYSSGNDIDFEGLHVVISDGATGPQDGDKFFISPIRAAISNMDVAITDTDQIAAAATAAGVPGDNSNALALTNLAQSQLTELGGSFESYYRGLVSEIGTISRAASEANSKIGERYMFSGYRTDQKAFTFNAATNYYDYNGDFGEIKVQFDKEANMAVNVQGSRVFSVPLSKSMPAALFDGTPVSYTEAADPVTGVTTVTVAIGNAGDPDYDTFTYSNVLDMANIMSAAWQYKNIDGTDLNADATLNETIALHRIKALSVPFDDATKQVLTIQAEVGTRQSGFKDRTTKLDNSTLTLQNALAKTEDADMTETIVDIQQAQTALESLRSSAATLLSQSLFDFLK